MRFFSFRYGRNCQRRTGRRDVEDSVDLVAVEPFTRFGGGDARLVLVIRVDQLHRLALDLAAEVVNGHLRCGDAARPGDVRIQATHVQQKADPDRVVRNTSGTLRMGVAEQARGEQACD